MNTKRSNAATKTVAPVGNKLRLTTQLKTQWHTAPRETIPTTACVFARCQGCGFVMGRGFVAKDIALTKVERQLWCLYCVEEHPDTDIIWIIRPDDYRHYGVKLTKAFFQRLVAQTIEQEAA